MNGYLVKRRCMRFLWSLPLLLGACGSSSDSRVANGVSCEGNTTIHVVAHGLKNHEGQVMVALFSTKDGFPNDNEKALQGGVATLDSTTATYTFEPVPCGTYAVAVLHDEDGNGAMNTKSFGRPAEGWGVSNDAKGSFGPPKFKNATFEADQDSVSVSLTLNY